MFNTEFVDEIIVPYQVLDPSSIQILLRECKSLNVNPEIFILTVRGICRHSLMTLNLLRKGLTSMSRDEVIKSFNLDVLVSEINKLKQKTNSFEIPTLPEIGDYLDKYQIKEILGKGATSVVYKAVNIFLKMDVALKVLSPQLVAEDILIQEKFLDEAVHSSKLSHNGAVRILDAEKRGKHTYIVMEYINGRTLEAILKQSSKFSSKAVIKIAIEICKVLEEGQKIGLIHQDIKPGNIMISNKSEVKLADFGLARIINEPSKYQTISGKIYGTPYYMSPEAFTDPEKIDFRSDMYSLGATFYHLLTGKLPFETNSIMKIISMHVYDKPINPIELSNDIPPILAKIVMKLLEKEPKNRYQSYSELLNDLRSVEDFNIQTRTLNRVA